jgi:diguanylate cyclase (GGDEF)-like protein
MRDYTDLEVLANLVMMLRSSVRGAIWLGDDDEEAPFYDRCRHQTAQVIPAFGRALSLLDAVDARGIRGVVAAVRRAHVPALNVFRPSVGDVASLLIASESFPRVMEDTAGAPWCAACEHQVGPLRGAVAKIGYAVALLRHGMEGAGILEPPIEETMENVINWEEFSLDWDRAAAWCQDIGVPMATVQHARLESQEAGPESALKECDGCVALEVTCIATRLYRPHGIAAARVVDARTLMAMLRVSFQLHDLESDEMYWRMKEWERRNHRYPLLREWRIQDPLGVLLDQRYWETDLSLLLKLSDPSDSLAFFKMDLDHFKNVNDRLGHTIGDQAIRLYCGLVKRALGGFAEVYRRGGDEVIALAFRLDAVQAAVLAEQTRDLIATEFDTWGTARRLAVCPTASIGLVVAEGGITADRVIVALDEAQREAKLNGKNRVACRDLRAHS